MRTPPRNTCVLNGEIVCCDDLCHGTSRTLCGLEEGTDFGLDDEFDEDYDAWGDDDPVASHNEHGGAS